MHEKEQFDAYVKLAEIRAARLNARRVFEWQITLGLWALLAASPIYIRARPDGKVLAAALAVIVVGYAFFWVRPIFTSGNNDAETMFYYLERAERLLDAGVEPRKRPEDLGLVNWKARTFGFLSRRNWWGWFQTITTACLALLAYQLIGTIRPPSN